MLSDSCRKLIVSINSGVRFIKKWWNLLVIFLTPLILLPIPIVLNSVQARCAYIVLILIIYWVSEAIPYAVTSLLPLALFPLAGVITGDKVGLNYFKDTKSLFLGSMALAQALEHVGLDRRMGLFVVSLVGSSVKWSMAGLMSVTAFLSMWINNSAATSIMIPAALAVTHELNKSRSETMRKVRSNKNQTLSQSIDLNFPEQSAVNEQISVNVINETRPEEVNQLQHEAISSSRRSSSIDNQAQESDPLKTAFMIAVAYSSAFGGLASLVGTGPNIFVKAFADDYYKSGPHAFTITFTNFLLFAFPIGFVMTILCWLILQLLYNRQDLLPWIKKSSVEIECERNVQVILKQQYKDLGPLKWQEKLISILFVLMIVLWITRDFGTFPGWEIIFRRGYVTDGTVAMIAGALPLILPNKNPFENDWKYHPILKWDQLSKKFPWGVFMLQGAGLAVADAFKESDLSSSIANSLRFITKASETAIICFTIVISALFTEFTSNFSCASIMFPILDSIATTANIHAARLILPSCMAVSLSFMLPIATPPNAMIFTSAHLKIIDLIKTGFLVKLVGCVVIFLASVTITKPIFQLVDPSATSFNSTNALIEP